MKRRSKRVLLTLPLALFAASGIAISRADHHVPTAHDRVLLAEADWVAAANLGVARHVTAVRTTAARTGRLLGSGGGLPDDTTVWVIQVSGSHYVCHSCSTFRPETVPEGSVITLVSQDPPGGANGFSLTDMAPDLHAVGTVRVLRG
jgi:hypothetical protein